VLFEHGAFTSADTAATSRALVFLALGLPAQVLVKAISPAFFAREDTLAPLLATLKAFVIAAVAAVLSGHFFGASGIAAAIAFGAWSNASSLVRQGVTTFGSWLDAEARRRLPRITAASLLMGALLWFAADLAWPLVSDSHLLVQAAVLLALIAASVVAYGSLLALFGVGRWREAAAAVRQGHDLQV
jgi:putative peptidoglycan lipid II flippase